MAARTRKIRHDENTILKIKTSQILNRLSNHTFGKVKLTATQVRAAEILLRKVLPDLAASQVDQTVTVRDARELTDAELANIATGGSAGDADEAIGPEEPSIVH
jgi:hypothetical protein